MRQKVNIFLLIGMNLGLCFLLVSVVFDSITLAFIGMVIWLIWSFYGTPKLMSHHLKCQSCGAGYESDLNLGIWGYLSPFPLTYEKFYENWKQMLPEKCGNCGGYLPSEEERALKGYWGDWLDGGFLNFVFLLAVTGMAQAFLISFISLFIEYLISI